MKKTERPISEGVTEVTFTEQDDNQIVVEFWKHKSGQAMSWLVDEALKRFGSSHTFDITGSIIGEADYLNENFLIARRRKEWHHEPLALTPPAVLSSSHVTAPPSGAPP